MSSTLRMPAAVVMRALPGRVPPRRSHATHYLGRNRHRDPRSRRLARTEPRKGTPMAEQAALDTVVAEYFEMWNSTDPDRRRKAIAVAWSDRARYLDPLLAGDGPDGLLRMVATVQERYPGARFELTDPVNAHHDRATWGWRMVD